jgi:hypothetical protein
MGTPEIDEGTLRELMNKELGEDDIRSLLGNDIKIITYPELANHTLDTVFDPQGRCVILFLTESDHDGHWIGLRKSSDGVEFFDSFGKQPDGDLSWLSSAEKIKLHETKPLLHDLLQSAGRVDYNKKKLQRDSSSTCGRHVCWRLLNPGPLSQYVNTLVGSGDPDKYVCQKTYERIHK